MASEFDPTTVSDSRIAKLQAIVDDLERRVTELERPLFEQEMGLAYDLPFAAIPEWPVTAEAQRWHIARRADFL